MSIAGSVTTVLSVIGWPALVFCLFAAAVTRDLPKAAKAGLRAALLGLAVIVSYGLLLVVLASWRRGETYRYKLTLSVDTPDGVKTAPTSSSFGTFPQTSRRKAKCTTQLGKLSISTLVQAVGRRLRCSHIFGGTTRSLRTVISTTTVGRESLTRSARRRLLGRGWKPRLDRNGDTV